MQGKGKSDNIKLRVEAMLTSSLVEGKTSQIRKLSIRKKTSILERYTLACVFKGRGKVGTRDL